MLPLLRCATYPQICKTVKVLHRKQHHWGRQRISSDRLMSEPDMYIAMIQIKCPTPNYNIVIAQTRFTPDCRWQSDWITGLGKTWAYPFPVRATTSIEVDQKRLNTHIVCCYEGMMLEVSITLCLEVTVYQGGQQYSTVEPTISVQ